VSSPTWLPKRTPRRLKVITAVAASLICVVAAGMWLYLGRGQVIQTERGERREVALTDGSVVQVDPESRLRVNYGPQLRRVLLERGRALFRVAKDSQRPFFVNADGTTVRAVGTAFAVEEGQDQVVITVAEGRVAVFPVRDSLAFGSTQSAGGKAGIIHDPLPSGTGTASREGSSPSVKIAERTQLATQARSSAATGEILLTANEQVTVSDSGSAEPVREVDSHRALAWAEGRLIFEDESVRHAVQVFNRYNRIQLKVRDEVLAHRSISGVFSAEDPESFVAFIQSVAPVRVTRDAEANITIDTK
jgi:transmembrane sensor